MATLPSAGAAQSSRPTRDQMAKDNGRGYGGGEKGFTNKSPLEPALVWLECQGSPSLISALTQGFDIRQTALPCICYVTLGMLHLPELQNREKVTFLVRLW